MCVGGVKGAFHSMGGCRWWEMCASENRCVLVIGIECVRAW